MENENNENSYLLADAFKKLSEETAAVIAEQLKGLRLLNRECTPELRPAMQKLLDDLAAFNPDGEEKPL